MSTELTFLLIHRKLNFRWLEIFKLPEKFEVTFPLICKALFNPSFICLSKARLFNRINNALFMFFPRRFEVY